MTADELAELRAAILAARLAAVAGPKKATVDGMTIENQSLADINAMEASLVDAVHPTGVRRGVYFTRLIPGGTE